jgi:hypothetical protein
MKYLKITVIKRYQGEEGMVSAPLFGEKFTSIFKNMYEQGFRNRVETENPE